WHSWSLPVRHRLLWPCSPVYNVFVESIHRGRPVKRPISRNSAAGARAMNAKFLTALPVYNEVAHVSGVLDEVLRYSPNVLVVDDGSSDGTSELLAGRGDVQVVRHE